MVLILPLHVVSARGKELLLQLAQVALLPMPKPDCAHCRSDPWILATVLHSAAVSHAGACICTRGQNAPSLGAVEGCGVVVFVPCSRPARLCE